MRQSQNHTPHATAQAGLAMLIVLQLVMLMALFAGVPPHPPEAIPLGGIAPILAAGFATAAGAMILGQHRLDWRKAWRLSRLRCCRLVRRNT